MPHWDAEGREEWVCQKGAHICTGHSTWVEGVGNVCDEHLHDPPLSLHEHCRRESGLTGPALDAYVNRHYGFGGG
jgi:hypothetical protein